MYGKLMSISDELMWKYFLFLTDLRGSEVELLKAEVLAGKLHPMEAKKRLARTIIAGFHGEAAAASADENWAKMFQQKETAEDLEEVAIRFEEISGIGRNAQQPLYVSPNDGSIELPLSECVIRLPKLLVALGLAASTTDANRKIAEKAVKLDGETTSGNTVTVASLPARIVVRLGKRAKVAVIT
jgi:tyrosyl-tRNA synthetase